jgi:hypothetical protein
MIEREEKALTSSIKAINFRSNLSMSCAISTKYVIIEILNQKETRAVFKYFSVKKF